MRRPTQARVREASMTWESLLEAAMRFVEECQPEELAERHATTLASLAEAVRIRMAEPQRPTTSAERPAG